MFGKMQSGTAGPVGNRADVVPALQRQKKAAPHSLPRPNSLVCGAPVACLLAAFADRRELSGYVAALQQLQDGVLV